MLAKVLYQMDAERHSTIFEQKIEHLQNLEMVKIKPNVQSEKDGLILDMFKTIGTKEEHHYFCELAMERKNSKFTNENCKLSLHRLNLLAKPCVKDLELLQRYDDTIKKQLENVLPRRLNE